MRSRETAFLKVRFPRFPWIPWLPLARRWNSSPTFVSMLDPKLLRDSPEIVRAAIARKHLDVDLDAILALDASWRALLVEVEALRSKQKAANNEMAAAKKGSPEFLAKVQEMK